MHITCISVHRQYLCWLEMWRISAWLCIYTRPGMSTRAVVSCSGVNGGRSEWEEVVEPLPPPRITAHIPCIAPGIPSQHPLSPSLLFLSISRPSNLHLCLTLSAVDVHTLSPSFPFVFSLSLSRSKLLLPFFFPPSLPFTSPLPPFFSLSLPLPQCATIQLTRSAQAQSLPNVLELLAMTPTLRYSCSISPIDAVL